MHVTKKYNYFVRHRKLFGLFILKCRFAKKIFENLIITIISFCIFHLSFMYSLSIIDWLYFCTPVRLWIVCPCFFQNNLRQISPQYFFLCYRKPYFPEFHFDKGEEGLVRLMDEANSRLDAAHREIWRALLATDYCSIIVD